MLNKIVLVSTFPESGKILRYYSVVNKKYLNENILSVNKLRYKAKASRWGRFTEKVIEQREDGFYAIYHSVLLKDGYDMLRRLVYKYPGESKEEKYRDIIVRQGEAYILFYKRKNNGSFKIKRDEYLSSGENKKRIIIRPFEWYSVLSLTDYSYYEEIGKIDGRQVQVQFENDLKMQIKYMDVDEWKDRMYTMLVEYFE
ncbi:hypothetical protein ACFL56_00650 [Candidatus Margulisiibacteriota bacterium]